MASTLASFDRPSSQTSTVIERVDLSNDNRGLTSLPTLVKTDPWLVSFSSDDPDNPLVRF
jgi:hypothetical protein